MEEAHFQYDVDAKLQPYNCSCPLSATYSTGVALCLQEAESCLYSCTTGCNYDLSTNSTPFVSAPSSPRKSTPFAAYSTSARAPPAALSDQQARDVVEYDAISGAYAEGGTSTATTASSPSLSEFEFSLRYSEADAWFNASSVSPPMSTAEELFYNGKIKPLNTILCSSASHCIYCFGCFSNAVFNKQLYGFQDSAHSFKAYTECLVPSPHAQHDHQLQHPLMLKQRASRHTKPTSTQSALEQWKKSMGGYDKGHVRQYAHGQHVERVMQISRLPLAHYSRKSRCDRGDHRRARSLSPMRVLHIDEKMMQARASFESDMHTTKRVSHTVAVDGGAATITSRHRRGRKSWTLKELLNMGDSRAHNKRRPAEHQQVNGAESVKIGKALRASNCRMEETEANLVKSAPKDNVVKRSLEEKRWHRKSTTHSEEVSSPWKLQQVEQEHADEHSCSIGSGEGQVEEMGKWNILHHKKGWLGCLGFTHNSTKHNSMKGLQSCIP